MPSRRSRPMSAKASTLKSSIEDFIRRQGIDAEMEQNLVKEAIHLHLLSAMSDAGILRYAVFQGGTALRLCYSGERYSEDLDFVCGKSGSYFTDVEFRDLIETALQTTKKTLSRDFGIDSNQISLKKPEHPDLVRQPAVNVAAWQIIVPVEDVILTVETPDEILADKAVALTARAALKFRDVWDAWFLHNTLDAKAD